MCVVYFSYRLQPISQGTIALQYTKYSMHTMELHGSSSRRKTPLHCVPTFFRLSLSPVSMYSLERKCTDDQECHLGTATIGVAAEDGSGLFGT